jgi:hypothetical protein
VRPIRNPIVSARTNPTAGELGPVSSDIESAMLAKCGQNCLPEFTSPAAGDSVAVRQIGRGRLMT